MTIDNKQTKEFKKRLYSFVLFLIRIIETLPNDRIGRIIGDQLLRSGTSILSNYIEGYSASSKKEFTNYFSISLKSTNESKVWVAILRDTKKVTIENAKKLLYELEELSKIFASSILTLRGKR